MANKANTFSANGDIHDTPAFDRKQAHSNEINALKLLQETTTTSNQSMRAQMDVLGTGTFGKLGTVAELEDLRVDNQALRVEVRQLRDQLKQVM